MKKRIVIWGQDQEGKKVFFSLGLKIKENEVDGNIIPADHLTQEFEEVLVKKWRFGEDVDFPEETKSFNVNLTVTEPIIPEGYKVDNDGILRRAQTEWNFMVMSQKLHDLYQHELEEIQEKVSELKVFDNNAWESLKAFWSKVQEQIRERNLLWEHAQDIKEKTNTLFDRMKELRKALDSEFRAMSEKNKEKFMSALEKIEQSINSGMSLQPLFNQLKQLQSELKDTKITKGHRRKIWERIDKAFKTVKEKRYGDKAMTSVSPSDRLQRRYNGLKQVIERMERSIQRDEDDLKFQTRRIEGQAGQLEAEIRKAKIQMIEERIRSKKLKLTDMHATRVQLEERMAKEKEREEKRKEKAKLNKTKEAIQEKIASEISEAKEVRKEELDKLLHAAEAINESRTKPKKEKKKETKDTSTEDKTKKEDDSVSETISETVEDLVDKAKNIGSKIGDKIEEVVEQFTKEDTDESDSKKESSEEDASIGETISETVEDIVEKAKSIGSKVGDKIEEVVEGIKEEKAVESDEKEEVSIGETISETVEDMVDTAKAIGSVLGGKLEDVIDSFTEEE